MPPPLDSSATSDFTTTLAIGQGAFWAASGIWPILHMRSFEAVTGPKVDRWLVKTVGGLIGVVGGVLYAAGRRGRVPRELRAVAAGTAAVLTAIDVVYVAKGRISPIYLLDALAESALIAGWVAAEGTGS